MVVIYSRMCYNNVLMEKVMNYTEIELTLTDEEWLVLFKEAHRRDITLNQLVEDILRKALDERN